MNRQIQRIAVLALVLIVALIVGTTYWQTWASGSLADKQDNAIQRVAQFKIKRGRIYAGDGKTVLAGVKAKKVAGNTLWFRTYPAATTPSPGPRRSAGRARRRRRIRRAAPTAQPAAP